MRILLIEDEEAVHSFLKHKLQERCFTVDVATDGERGSFLARTTDYDLIILDMMLPHKLGDQVCTEVRARGKTCPILVVSVKTDTHTKVDMLNAGADDYVSKPFSFDELLARIGALLRRPPHVAGAVLHVADLELNPTTYLVVRNGIDIQLTRKEFSLLHYLMRNVGIVLSRGMILEHVWDMDTDPFSNTIEAHVASLRRKVDTPFDQKLIKTVMGRGYKIVDMPVVG